MNRHKAVGVSAFLVLMTILPASGSYGGNIIADVSFQVAAESEVQSRTAGAAAGNGFSATITYQLQNPAEVSVMICDLQGNIVAQPTERKEQRNGRFNIDWDGQCPGNIACPAGLYFPVIKAKSKTFGTESYNPTEQPWGEEVKVEGLRYDAGGQKISYTITEQAMVRIRAGENEGGPFYKTVSDWQLRKPGSYEEPWDGMDSTGQIDVAAKLNFQIAFDAFTVPVESIWVPVSAKTTTTGLASLKQYPVHPPHGKRLAYYSVLPGGLAPDLRIAVQPVGFAAGAHKSTTTRGTIPISVAISHGTLLEKHKEAAEIYLYVDGQMVHEGPAATLPAQVKLDTGKFANGLHMVTVNLRTSEDRAASSSFQLSINN